MKYFNHRSCFSNFIYLSLVCSVSIAAPGLCSSCHQGSSLVVTGAPPQLWLGLLPGCDWGSSLGLLLGCSQGSSPVEIGVLPGAPPQLWSGLLPRCGRGSSRVVMLGCPLWCPLSLQSRVLGCGLHSCGTGLSCPVAHGIFWIRGSTALLHWQADFYSQLSHQGSGEVGSVTKVLTGTS